MTHQVVTTSQGAMAMLDLATGEVMHPVVGPSVEAADLYVAQSRLAERLRGSEARPLVVYDIGLGAGSNALAAWQLSETRVAGRPLEIVSFDRTTAALELALETTHATAFGWHGAAATAARALLATGAYQTANTNWRLVLGELPATLDTRALRLSSQLGTSSARPGCADIIFWDPFSPRVNPDLWTVAAFSALRRVSGPRATLYTYSSSTAIRAALFLAGFAVGVGQTTGTRPTTAAAIDHTDLATPLSGRWLDRLMRSSAPYPIDAPRDALERISACPQFQTASDHAMASCPAK